MGKNGKSQLPLGFSLVPDEASCWKYSQSSGASQLPLGFSLVPDCLLVSRWAAMAQNPLRSAVPFFSFLWSQQPRLPVNNYSLICSSSMCYHARSAPTCFSAMDTADLKSGSTHGEGFQYRPLRLTLGLKHEVVWRFKEHQSVGILAVFNDAQPNGTHLARY